jgi:hypothetical protein
MNQKNDEPNLNPDILKRASLYQLIEELVMSEHSRFLEEDCGVKDTDVQVPEKDQ